MLGVPAITTISERLRQCKVEINSIRCSCNDIPGQGGYHRQMTREFQGKFAAHLVSPLMRPQDPNYTRIILVTFSVLVFRTALGT